MPQVCARRSSTIEQIRLELLPDINISNQTKTANFEWLDAIDVVNMVDACELIIHSSLERKESRGPFFRGDFPATDNKQLARRQRSQEIRQWLAVRAAALRFAVFRAWF